MLFNSIDFILFFLTFLTSITLFKKNFKLILIFFSSIFYAYWSLKFLFLLYFVILISFLLGKYIFKSKNKVYFLIIYALVVISLLVYFKYGGFFLKDSSNLNNIILPIGISFYLFQSISYLIDIYKGKIIPTKFINYFFFIIFFPQIISGPILRAKQFMPQIEKKFAVFSYNNFKKGILLIIWGYFLKTGLADNAFVYTDRHLLSPLQSNSITLLISIFFYGMQIYADFFGYTLIAIGISKIVGLHIPANFNKPYGAKNFQDFWRRWHISLSRFFRDYLYIPMGGNKILGGHLTVLIVMTIAGAWHGSSIFFIIWGFAHGALIIIERFLPKFLTGSFFYRLITLIFIFILWIPFKVNDFETIINIGNQILIFDEISPKKIINKFLFIKILFFISIIILADLFLNKKILIKLKNSKYFSIVISILLFITILLGNLNGQEFIYFRF